MVPLFFTAADGKCPGKHLKTRTIYIIKPDQNGFDPALSI